MINVWGDSIGAGVVAHLSRKEVEEFEKNNDTDGLLDIISSNGINKAYEKNDDMENTTAF